MISERQRRAAAKHSTMAGRPTGPSESARGDKLGRDLIKGQRPAQWSESQACGFHAGLVLALFLISSPPSTVADSILESTPSAHDIIRSARKSVVVVECLGPEGELSLGTGFAVQASMIATNAHVVSECSDVWVRSERASTPLAARTIYIDTRTDVAVLFVNGLELAPLAWGPQQPVSAGQRVYALGHPQGLEFSASDGIVSAVRELDSLNLIQITAPISPGSSGGPLLDESGRVVGMTTLFLREGQNLNFAIPASEIRSALEAARAQLRRRAAAGRPIATAAMPSATAAQLARSLRKRKLYDRADAILESGLVSDPTNLSLLLEMSELRFAQGRLDAAEGYAKKMLDLGPYYAPAHQALGAILFWRGDVKQGCDEQRRALALDPDEEYTAYASTYLASCELMTAQREGLSGTAARPRIEKALEYIDASLRFEEVGESASVHALRAAILESLGRKGEANKTAKLALSLPSLDDEARKILRDAGLPANETRIVSFGRSPDYLTLPVFDGVVVNEGEELLRFVRVAVECKDSGGKIVGTGTAIVEPSVLAPNESGHFSVHVKGPLEGKSDCTPKILGSYAQ